MGVESGKIYNRILNSIWITVEPMVKPYGFIQLGCST